MSFNYFSLSSSCKLSTSLTAQNRFILLLVISFLSAGWLIRYIPMITHNWLRLQLSSCLLYQNCNCISFSFTPRVDIDSIFNGSCFFLHLRGFVVHPMKVSLLRMLLTSLNCNMVQVLNTKTKLKNSQCTEDKARRRSTGYSRQRHAKCKMIYWERSIAIKSNLHCN